MSKVSVKVAVDAKLPTPAVGKKKAELFLATAVLKDTRPFVPFLSGSLNQRSHVEAGRYVVYPGPYARYLYEGKRMRNALTKKGPRWIPKLSEWRWPAGAKLEATNTPLRYNGAPQPNGKGGFEWVGGGKVAHPNATDHWIDASKGKNLQAWLDGVAKILKGESVDAE